MKRRRFCLVVRYCLAASAVVAALMPVYWIVVVSVAVGDEIQRFPPALFPTKRGVDAYIELFKETNLVLWIGNSVVVCGVSIVISIVIAALAGYSISRFRSQVGGSVGYALLATRMIPGSLLVIPMYMIFRKWGLLDSYAGLIIAYVAFETPFATWMLKGYFDSIPVSIEEQALIDGCTRLGVMWRIVLPLSRPGIAASAMASAILAWSDYLFARTFVVSPEKWTVPIGVYSFVGEHVVHWNQIMAASVMVTIPIVVFFVVMERYFVMGLTAGAVK
jgi:multiple sugar transport system permease protein